MRVPPVGRALAAAELVERRRLLLSKISSAPDTLLCALYASGGVLSGPGLMHALAQDLQRELTPPQRGWRFTITLPSRTFGGFRRYFVQSVGADVLAEWSIADRTLTDAALRAVNVEGVMIQSAVRVDNIDIDIRGVWWYDPLQPLVHSPISASIAFLSGTMLCVAYPDQVLDRRYWLREGHPDSAVDVAVRLLAGSGFNMVRKECPGGHAVDVAIGGCPQAWRFLGDGLCLNVTFDAPSDEAMEDCPVPSFVREVFAQGLSVKWRFGGGSCAVGNARDTGFATEEVVAGPKKLY